MKFPLCLTQRKQTASFSIAGSMLAIAPLWLMLAAANTSAYAQTPDNVSNASATTAPSPGDWTEFLRDNMQRWDPYETVLGVGNVGSLKLEWSNSTHSFATDTPIVANGVVYFGSWDGNVYALNASTGAKLWSYTTGAPVFAALAVANGVAYIGSSNGIVYALNASTGAKLWSFATGNESQLDSPAVANGVVYIGSLDDNVYALNASTGAKLWSYTTGASVNSSPALGNGVVYIGSDDDNLYALNASTGADVRRLLFPGLVRSKVLAIGRTEPERRRPLCFISFEDRTRPPSFA
ncbi:MAG: PQQ-binding-like beta-propeller repeat protein [Alloacidobacterium sp.]